jgi:sulfatase modifying factor 1
MLLIAVGCDDSPQTQQSTEQGFDLEGSSVDEQPDEAEQPTKPVHADLPIIELPSITNTIGMTFNKIPAGTFTMGSPATETDRQDNETQHPVTITKPFYMQTTEVTQGQWKEVMGTEPWKGEQYVKEGPNNAATYVSWDDAVAFCKKLSEKESKTYRLPTEAEWEYACRAGTETTWNFGDDEKALGDYAWYRENAWDIGEAYAHQVGLKKPNAFGLYDMHGNVFEWCHDYYGEDYYKQSPAKDPTGPTSGSSRVLRGGSWGLDSRVTRSAFRLRSVAGVRSHHYGFRLVRDSKAVRDAAITAAIGKGDWETVLALDPDNEAGTQLKAAAVAAALAKGDWKAVLALDATNSEGLRLLAAAITAAIGKGDWKTVLSLDPDNREGLQLKAAAEKAAILARAPITNTIGMKLNKIPAGTFTIGSPESEADREDDETQHPVTITQAFYMQTTEVTQGQWTAVMGTVPWKGQGYAKEGPNYAATYVNWDDAVAFCKKLSEQEGRRYRLPTEAEWEYACRAETKTTWSFGDDEKEFGDYAWYDGNAGEEYAHQVALKKPNAFGLYDMHGNVYEWCHDYYDEDYYKQSSEIAKYLFIKDPTGPVTGSPRVLRGGSWYDYSPNARSANRYRYDADNRNFLFGFRLVRELD